jgi:hypothetical protein
MSFYLSSPLRQARKNNHHLLFIAKAQGETWAGLSKLTGTRVEY